MKIGGLVLCGGQSKRMGLPKATLPFGPEVMLVRIVRLLRGIVNPVFVVAAADQQLPDLGANVTVVRDRHENRGPLAGLYAGLLAARDQVEAVYATSCDVPLLQPEFVARLVELLGDKDIVVPVEGDFIHPLAGVYRTRLVLRIEELLAAEQFRPRHLIDHSISRKVSVNDLREVDPELSSLLNLNTAEDYLQALYQAGYQPTAEVLERLGNS